MGVCVRVRARARACAGAGVWCVCVGMFVCGFYSQLRASFTYFGELLRSPHDPTNCKTSHYRAVGQATQKYLDLIQETLFTVQL